MALPLKLTAVPRRGRGQLLAGLASAVLVAACAQAAAPGTPVTQPATPGQSTVEPPPGSPETTVTPAPGVSTPPAAQATSGTEPTSAPATPGGAAPTDPGVALPADPWRTAELRDVRTGQALVINELVGRLVVIEPMAIWCTTCRAQQNEAREALARLGAGDDIVYISLDVDPTETEAALAAYAAQRDYPWHFAVASVDVSRSLAQTFGDQVLSPPSTPEILITPDGHAEVSFGLSGADELEARFAALLP